MKYVKIIGFFAIIYLVYLGYSSFMDDSLEVAENVNKTLEVDEVKKSNNREVSHRKYEYYKRIRYRYYSL